MSFLKKLNAALKKIRKSGWKLTLIIILVFFSANPSYLSEIPFVYESFIYANDIYYTVMDFINRGFAYPVIGSILGFVLSLLPVVALCIVALWVISLIATPITDLIIKAPVKKKPYRRPRPSVKPINRTPSEIKPIEKSERLVKPMSIENIQESEVSTKASEPVKSPVPPRAPVPPRVSAPVRRPAPPVSQPKSSRGSSKLMTFFEKLISFIRLNILKIGSGHVFFKKNDSYIRVQRINFDDTIGGNQYKTEEIIKWNSQNSVSIPFKYGDSEVLASAYRTKDGKSAFVRMPTCLEDKELIPNTPTALWVENKQGETVLVMVTTWIGDVFND